MLVWTDHKIKTKDMKNISLDIIKDGVLQDSAVDYFKTTFGIELDNSRKFEKEKNLRLKAASLKSDDEKISLFIKNNNNLIELLKIKGKQDNQDFEKTYNLKETDGLVELPNNLIIMEINTAVDATDLYRYKNNQLFYNTGYFMKNISTDNERDFNSIKMLDTSSIEKKVSIDNLEANYEMIPSFYEMKSNIRVDFPECIGYKYFSVDDPGLIVDLWNSETGALVYRYKGSYISSAKITFMKEPCYKIPNYLINNILLNSNGILNKHFVTKEDVFKYNRSIEYTNLIKEENEKFFLFRNRNPRLIYQTFDKSINSNYNNRELVYNKNANTIGMSGYSTYTFTKDNSLIIVRRKPGSVNFSNAKTRILDGSSTSPEVIAIYNGINKLLGNTNELSDYWFTIYNHFIHDFGDITSYRQYIRLFYDLSSFNMVNLIVELSDLEFFVLNKNSDSFNIQLKDLPTSKYFSSSNLNDNLFLIDDQKKANTNIYYKTLKYSRQINKTSDLLIVDAWEHKIPFRLQVKNLQFLKDIPIMCDIEDNYTVNYTSSFYALIQSAYACVSSLDNVLLTKGVCNTGFIPYFKSNGSFTDPNQFESAIKINRWFQGECWEITKEYAHFRINTNAYDFIELPHNRVSDKNSIEYAFLNKRYYDSIKAFGDAFYTDKKFDNFSCSFNLGMIINSSKPEEYGAVYLEQGTTDKYVINTEVAMHQRLLSRFNQVDFDEDTNSAFAVYII